jgi:exopolysaccharide biosynthesis polyprenyl glycosylphosphotransferase
LVSTVFTPPSPVLSSQYFRRSGNQWRPAHANHWRRAYANRLVVTDAVACIWAVVGALLLTVGPEAALARPAWLASVPVNYYAVSALLVGLWMLALTGVGSRQYRLVGTGTREYKTVGQAAIAVLVVVALLGFTLQVEFSRGFILLALPATFLALLVSRALWRSWLRLHRQEGRFCSRALLVGSAGPTRQIAADLQRHPEAGYHLVGALVSGRASGGRLLGDIPVLGTVDDLMEAVETSQADTVIVTDGHNLEPSRLRELSWRLEPGRQHLVMAPSLTDVAGPRIHARPVAGLPLVHVETPRYEGVDRLAKRAFDIGGSLLLLLLLAPALTIIAVVIVVSSPGGVFFAHERIGKHGRPFRMLKFRSMVANADDRLADLLKAQGRSDQPLFKIDNDPRITRIGGFLRRYSIDEIPQLINVLRGEMSLVGPRPQVAKEVALYDNAAARRLFVAPGMTGLWQVSGRSNLSWNESVRLDLFYVENWSLLADIAILARTVRAVVASEGAV